MSEQKSKLEEVTNLLTALKLLLKPNPEAQKLRLENKKRRISKRQHKDEWDNLKFAERKIKRFKKDLSKDEDGYTEEDKAMIESLNDDLNKKRFELIEAIVE